MRKVGLTVTYPAAEPDALEDIVYVGVVVPLDAVQTSSSVDHRRQRFPVASSHASNDTPQKRDCCLQGLLSQDSCAQVLRRRNFDAVEEWLLPANQMIDGREALFAG
jgi:hypothetical protein